METKGLAGGNIFFSPRSDSKTISAYIIQSVDREKLPLAFSASEDEQDSVFGPALPRPHRNLFLKRSIMQFSVQFLVARFFHTL
jgi:hypothetical protein